MNKATKNNFQVAKVLQHSKQLKPIVLYLIKLHIGTQISGFLKAPVRNFYFVLIIVLRVDKSGTAYCYKALV